MLPFVVDILLPCVFPPSHPDQDQCVECEAAMQAQNDEMMALVMEQYNTMSISMEEEKKAKLEQLYDQIVSFQESIDSAKSTLETTDREAETDARVSPEADRLQVSDCPVTAEITDQSFFGLSSHQSPEDIHLR